MDDLLIPVTGAMAAAFAAVHLFVGRLHVLDRLPRSRWLSFAGGVAVAYVFLHMLPEIASHGETFARALGLDLTLAESAVYAVALAGLALFYGTEKALLSSRQEVRSATGEDRPEKGVFWLHICSSSLLIFVIAYLLNHREDLSWPGLAVFFIAMILHFASADFGSRTHHPELYDREGRWVLSIATISGWVTGLFVEVPELAVGALFAFVGGGIILTILKEELPAERESRFVPFLFGTVLYGLLVVGEEMLVGLGRTG